MWGGLQAQWCLISLLKYVIYEVFIMCVNVCVILGFENFQKYYYALMQTMPCSEAQTK